MSGRSWKSRSGSRAERKPFTIRTDHQKQSDTIKNTGHQVKRSSPRKKGDILKYSSTKCTGEKGSFSFSSCELMTDTTKNKFKNGDRSVKSVTAGAILPANYKNVHKGVDNNPPFFPAACTISLCPACRDLECTMRNDRDVVTVSYQKPSTSLITKTLPGDTTKFVADIKDKNKYGSLLSKKACKKSAKLDVVHNCGNHQQSLFHQENPTLKQNNYSTSILPSKLVFDKTNDYTKCKMLEKQYLHKNKTYINLKDSSPIDKNSMNNNKPIFSTDSFDFKRNSRRPSSASNRGLNNSRNSNKLLVQFRSGENPLEPCDSLISRLKSQNNCTLKADQSQQCTESIKYPRRECNRSSIPQKSFSPHNQRSSPQRNSSFCTYEPRAGSGKCLNPLKYQRLSAGQNLIIHYNDKKPTSLENRSSDGIKESTMNRGVSTGKTKSHQQPWSLTSERLPSEFTQDRNSVQMSYSRKSSRHLSNNLQSKKTTPTTSWCFDTVGSMCEPSYQNRRSQRSHDIRDPERDTEFECIRNAIANCPRKSIKDVRLECQQRDCLKTCQPDTCKHDALSRSSYPHTEKNTVKNCFDLNGTLYPVGNDQEMKMLTNYYQKKRRIDFWQHAISLVLNNILFTTQVVIIGSSVFFIACCLQDVNHFFQMAIVFIIMAIVYVLVCQPFLDFP